MGVKVRCLKCGDVIESKHVHDFKVCSCENIFIDGGNEYVRYGGKALEDGSAEFVLKNGKTKNVLDKYKKLFHGVGGNTKIGLVRKELEDLMYLDIGEMDPLEQYKIFIMSSSSYKQFFNLTISDIKRSEEKLQTYKYKFTNDCSIGKMSFGTEEDLIATPNCPILKTDGTVVMLGDLKYGDEVISIKRIIYSKDVHKCTSKLIYKFRYYNEYVYNIPFRSRKFHLCADGFFVGGIGE